LDVKSFTITPKLHPTDCGVVSKLGIAVSCCDSLSLPFETFLAMEVATLTNGNLVEIQNIPFLDDPNAQRNISNMRVLI
jgi:hypothetical protein